MAEKRKIEIFSAGCAFCQEVIDAVKREANSSCEVIVHDMRDTQVVQRAKNLGIGSVPAVVIDGKLASYEVLKSGGLAKGIVSDAYGWQDCPSPYSGKRAGLH